MTNDKVRQDFEAHTRTLPNFTEDMLRRKPNGAYWEPTVYAAFEGYKTGRAAERAEIVAKLESEGVAGDIAAEIWNNSTPSDITLEAVEACMKNAAKAAITKILEVI